MTAGPSTPETEARPGRIAVPALRIAPIPDSEIPH